MTIDHIKEARRIAEERIALILQDLQTETGMEVRAVTAEAVPLWQFMRSEIEFRVRVEMELGR